MEMDDDDEEEEEMAEESLSLTSSVECLACSNNMLSFFCLTAPKIWPQLSTQFAASPQAAATPAAPFSAVTATSAAAIRAQSSSSCVDKSPTTPIAAPTAYETAPLGDPTSVMGVTPS